MSSKDLVKVSVSPETFARIIAQVATYISVNEYLRPADSTGKNYFETVEEVGMGSYAAVVPPYGEMSLAK